MSNPLPTLPVLSAETIAGCRHPKEKLLFGLMAAVTVLALVGLFAASFVREEIVAEVKSHLIETHRNADPTLAALSDDEVFTRLSDDDKQMHNMVQMLYWPVVLCLPLAFLIVMIAATGIRYGELRANGVKLDRRQYAEVYALCEELALRLGFRRTPDIYLMNGNGALNAFACCVPGYRNFVAIYSDVLERCLQTGDVKTLKLILGHELGHLKFGHVQWWYNFLTLWGNLPYIKYLFGLPLSRSREYGCDKIGQLLSDDADGRGLMMFAAGKHLYRQVDMDAYLEENYERGGFWATVYNFTTTHPITSWRIAALRQGRHGGIIFDLRTNVGAARSLFAVTAGLIAAVAILLLGELAFELAQPSWGNIDIFDPANRQRLAEQVAATPWDAWLILAAADGLATLIGAWIAARLAGQARWIHAGIVGVVMLVLGVLGMAFLTPPMWYVPLDLAMYPLGVALGARLATPPKPAATSFGHDL